MYAWVAHFLTEMGKAVIDDVMKAVPPRPNREMGRENSAGTGGKLSSNFFSTYEKAP
ncbi:DUF3077 domain-containing protein [Pseudomonas sp. BW7P1]|uniref:DUF3077 domain-containing protein n=1 Tax=Pseudomonas TaxID=286 RepID=UPI0039183FEC